MVSPLWFVINMGFVALFITSLFVNRAYREALHAGDRAAVKRLKRLRLVMAVCTAAAFLAMSAAFLVSMGLNV
ncbi:hypothetical protein BG53_05630 [Paenibacillus darwinianus]|uniref:Uncharacterized protein n=1 Tax=Paenibacillus darwinianus TaxID=1380763 RepID=A0A9W5W709_9BACL|nr:hypothetical protein [Paenibacillus darwinianus]EXX86681.1 hypothetical protein BG53_05630 [Paenibacillus darwinianus]EXX86996.1 hypothetical protein BG52_05195 [Paenibacillus darwinianus]EXX91937.1 hypothetical protein CH50_12560 [Paenibacillus darwinianus]